MKTIYIIMALLMAGTISTSKMIVFRLYQETGITKYASGDKPISKEDLNRILDKLASIDKRVFIFVVSQSNVPASEVIGTIGAIQRTGLHNLALVCPGTDGTNSGTWQVTVDAVKKLVPSCIKGRESESGFQIENPINPIIMKEIERVSQQGDGD